MEPNINEKRTLTISDLSFSEAVLCTCSFKDVFSKEQLSTARFTINVTYEKDLKRKEIDDREINNSNIKKLRITINPQFNQFFHEWMPLDFEVNFSFVEKLWNMKEKIYENIRLREIRSSPNFIQRKGNVWNTHINLKNSFPCLGSEPKYINYDELITQKDDDKREIAVSFDTMKIREINNSNMSEIEMKSCISVYFLAYLHTIAKTFNTSVIFVHSIYIDEKIIEICRRYRKKVCPEYIIIYFHNNRKTGSLISKIEGNYEVTCNGMNMIVCMKDRTLKSYIDYFFNNPWKTRTINLCEETIKDIIKYFNDVPEDVIVNFSIMELDIRMSTDCSKELKIKLIDVIGFRRIYFRDMTEDDIKNENNIYQVTY